jgi:hypothetical protein
MARSLGKLDELHVLALNAPGKVRSDAVERDHGVTPAVVRHAVDQVDHPVLKAANVKPE